MKLAEWSVNRPVTTAMIYVAMIVLGVASIPRLGLDLMPEIEIPAVSVLTAYEGAGPEEVETIITEPIEDSLSTISGVDEVISLSKEGMSAVTLRFEWGENIDEAMNEVRDKVELAKVRLPDEADKPVIFKFDISMQPIMIISITAEESLPNLQKITKDLITDPLKRIKGVAAATPAGGLERQIRVDIDRDKLAALEIPVERVQAVLAAQNISTPGGDIKSGSVDYLLRTPEEFRSAEQIGDTVVAQFGDVPVKLSDVATVRDYFKERKFDLRINGKRGVAVFVQKQSGENTVQVARAVAEELASIGTKLPSDVKAKVVMDNSDFILASVRSVRDSVLWACLFVFLVLLFFLRDLRASLIVAVSIPISLIITFLLMYLAGYTINTTTLSALAVAVGTVVDNAIVVVDNIYRHRQRGQRKKEAAVFGASEVGMAVAASTLTTIAIFAPLLFVGGITRIIFGQFASILVMALVVSLLTALMLAPMLCSKFLIVHGTRPTTRIGGYLYDLGEKALVGLENTYARFLRWSLSHRKTVFVTCGALLVWSIGLAKFVGTEFIPEEDQGRLVANIELPVGTRYEQTGEAAQKLAQIMSENVTEKKDVFARWGVYGGAETGAYAMEEETHKGLVFMSLIDKEDRDVSPRQIIDRLRPLAEKLPGVIARFSAEDPMLGAMFGSGKKLLVELYGHDMEAARKYAQDVWDALESVEGVRDIELSRQEEKPELKVVVNRDKASRLGLDVRRIGKTVETFFAGSTASKYREAGDEYDIEIRLQEQDRDRLEDLRDALIDAPGGQVRLADVAEIELGYGPTKVERKDQARYLTVSADIQGRDLGSTVKDVEAALAKVSPPAGFSYKFAGAEKEKREAFTLLVGATLLGMILVYMVMASQFESYRDPFIIFLSVPFGIVGVIAALAITGLTMNVVTFIAMILLVGIVVNNGIVLISFIGMLRQRGLDVHSAILEGGRSRLRPVLSTTITTLLGLTPLALMHGTGSETWVPFAVTSIGGLSLGTVITLILMPALYSVFEERKQKALKATI